MASSVRVTVCTSRRRSMWCLKWWPHELQSHTRDSILSGGECPSCLRCWQALSEFLSPSEGTPTRALKDKGVSLSSPDCSSCTGSALGPPDQIPRSGQAGLFLEEWRAGGRHTRNLFSTTGYPERLAERTLLASGRPLVPLAHLDLLPAASSQQRPGGRSDQG